MKAVINIRKVIETDENSIRNLLDELENRTSDPAVFQRIFLHYLLRENTLFFVAETDQQEIVGFISCLGQLLLHHEGLVYEIQELIVTSGYQGKGIGQLLIKQVREELKPYEVKSIEVTSNKRRIKAHEFYQAVGFKNSHEKFTCYF
jgi:PhnO protein